MSLLSINICLLFMNSVTRYVTNLVSERGFVELERVELCSCFSYSVVISFRSIMVSFGSAPLEKTQSSGDPNPEPLSKPILDAIFQAVVMAMEKRIYNRENLDLFLFLQKLLPLHQNKKQKDTKRIKKERKI